MGGFIVLADMGRAARRIRNLSIVSVGAAVLYFGAAILDTALVSRAEATGWALITLVCFLALLNVRKRLGLLPLGPAAVWTELHIYVGLGALAVFGIHTGFETPGGILNSLLWWSFMVVGASGVFGALVSRWVPPRLTSRGQTIIFERIPGVTRGLADEVDALVQEIVRQGGAATITDLYQHKLLPYFERPRFQLAHLVGSERPTAMLISDVRARRRFADAEVGLLLDEIAERILLKSSLDHQRAHQALLRLWLFVHIPATVVLFVLMVTHSFVVHAFQASVG